MNEMKKLFRVEGKIEVNGEWFREYVYANHEAHAVKLIALRFQKKYPQTKIFLVDTSVSETHRHVA